MTFKPTRSRTHTITLEYPFEFGGRAFMKVEFRRPLPPDLRQLADGKGSESDRSSRLIGDLAGMTPEEVDCLDIVDIGQINAWLEPILDPKGPPSGATGK